MIAFDATFFALVAFLLFAGLVWYLKVPALIARALDARSQAIAKELNEAQRLREDARTLLRNAEAQRDAAERDAASIIAHAKEQAEALIAEARAEHSEAMTRRRRQAEERVARAEEQAEADVRAAAAEQAVAAAERLLRERLTAEGHAQIIAEGVRELEHKLG